MDAPEPEREADEKKPDKPGATAFFPFTAKTGLTLRRKDNQGAHDNPKAPADRGA